MLKPILSSLVLFIGVQAHAERLSASMFGLTPETGYLEAVTADEVCNPRTDVLLSSGGNNSEFITKCDGSNIGWVTRLVKAVDLSDDARSPDQFDLEIKTGTVYDRFGNDAITIYTCGKSRADELNKHPEVKPAKNRKKTYAKMKSLSAEGQTLEVQLFFNEYLYSGKCIGGIKVVNEDVKL